MPDDEETELLDGKELLFDADVALVAVVFGLGLCFTGGAWSAGTAPARVNAVMLACCALAEPACASDPVAAGGAELFLTADPIANAATSPSTNATAKSSQRFRTS